MLKSSSKLAQSLIERAERQRKKMAPLKALLAAYNGEQWAQITDRLRKKAQIYEHARAGHENLKNIPEVELKMILAREEEIKAIITMPEDVAAILKAMQDVHDKLLAKINDKRKQIRNT